MKESVGKKREVPKAEKDSKNLDDRIQKDIRDWDRYHFASRAVRRHLSWVPRFVDWINDFKVVPPGKYEAYKYETRPKSRNSIRGFLLMGFIPAYMGATLYIFMEKGWWEEYQIREPGYSTPMTRTFSHYFRNWLRFGLRYYWDMNLFLWAQDLQLSRRTAKDMTIPVRKRLGMEALQRDHYLRNRNNLFDFMYLGERCLLYTSPSPRDRQKSRMPSSA
eukprot:TRINITY_DN7182_c0_g1_i1.p1 TRINITY_DN7182_c0_g1~~TRINITY_DN7182_c0_g1_i1.p1  ORF type:complete len:219 (+),score=25.69 TRINITY_DN7182_c0_g1_i1:45-701(+)